MENNINKNNDTCNRKGAKLRCHLKPSSFRGGAVLPSGGRSWCCCYASPPCGLLSRRVDQKLVAKLIMMIMCHVMCRYVDHDG